MEHSHEQDAARIRGPIQPGKQVSNPGNTKRVLRDVLWAGSEQRIARTRYGGEVPYFEKEIRNHLKIVHDSKLPAQVNRDEIWK